MATATIPSLDKKKEASAFKGSPNSELCQKLRHGGFGEFVHFRLKRTAGHTGVGAHGGLRRPHFGLGILAGGIKNARPFQFALTLPSLR